VTEAFRYEAFISSVCAGSSAVVDYRLSIGLGMVPRGEVGLIFASIGKSLKIVDDALFSAIVIMVIVTTLITLVLLRYSLQRSEVSR
jgi:Kef-type K+ transport system membrane component KefB